MCSESEEVSSLQRTSGTQGEGGGVSGVLGEGVQPDLHALWAYRHL
jgi:hypothetical protein